MFTQLSSHEIVDTVELSSTTPSSVPNTICDKLWDGNAGGIGEESEIVKVRIY
jgi:hypothetical protein